jgi:2-methylfumaryl-CoA hydratase
MRAPKYGRLLDDVEPGDVYLHPWEVTIDEGMLALFFASFQCALPTYTSVVAAREVGLSSRPVHPLMLLNLGISFSVQDVSERAIANLSYVDARFPEPCFVGDTVHAVSRVLGKKPVSNGDKGVVHVATELVTDDGRLVCSFERKALLRAGRALDPNARGNEPATRASHVFRDDPPRAPASMLGTLAPRARGQRPGSAWEDFAVGDVIAHDVGRTVSEAEAMQLATLFRNSHPLHLDEVYCRTGSFAKTRVVFGGLALTWVMSLASRDIAACAIWDLGVDDGAHPSGILSGDTLYAASKVIAKEDLSPAAGSVTFRVVGLKNVPSRALADRPGLFDPELGKTANQVPEKAVEVTRTLLVRKREAR